MVLVLAGNGRSGPSVAMVVAVAVTTMVTYGNQRFRASAEPAVILLGLPSAVVAIGERRVDPVPPRSDRSNSTQ